MSVVLSNKKAELNHGNTDNRRQNTTPSAFFETGIEHGNTDNSRQNTATPASDISLTELIKNVNPDVVELPVVDNSAQVQELPVVGVNEETIKNKTSVYNALVNNLTEKAKELGLSVDGVNDALSNIDLLSPSRTEINLINQELKKVFDGVPDSDVCFLFALALISKKENRSIPYLSRF